MFRLLIGSVCISFSPIFIKLAALPPDSAGFYRMLFAGLSLAVLMLLRGESLKMAQRPRLLLCCAGVILAIDFMCWHRSIELVGPGFSTLLGNFQVFFTALFSWLFLKQKISKMFMLAVAMALCGLLFITGVDWKTIADGYKLGIFLGLLTAVFYSGYILLIKASMDDSSVSSVPAMLTVAIPCSLLLAVITPLNGASFAIPSNNSLFALIGVGVVSTTIGWSLISSAIKHIQATVAGLILLLQPTLALIWDTLFFGRPTRGIEVFGILLILSAIYIGSYRR
ncbi:MAG: DMT family transporter [Desulfuromusa sp.]|nr:DMT family transporter [Desulfuromusa sp.]